MFNTSNCCVMAFEAYLKRLLIMCDDLPPEHQRAVQGLVAVAVSDAEEKSIARKHGLRLRNQTPTMLRSPSRARRFQAIIMPRLTTGLRLPANTASLSGSANTMFLRMARVGLPQRQGRYSAGFLEMLRNPNVGPEQLDGRTIATNGRGSALAVAIATGLMAAVLVAQHALT